MILLLSQGMNIFIFLKEMHYKCRLKDAAISLRAKQMNWSLLLVL